MRKAYQFLDEARVFPIPLREDVTVRIVDLPHDLTRAEAEKIGRIVMALTPVEIGSHFGNGGEFDTSGGEG